ncbi:hypothetical protein PHYPSEUDO_013698 [Phytophthora pseudosyringae]|uniref:RxLR effector protein n=1 Tax=Phytophthora pseudosyringae TaxID=221518 RepID=A0A8T1W7T3_9STRA|nr:hypothetical protein PHYPSEUDO_013698 [Phytophthora pseudosyringae]
MRLYYLVLLGAIALLANTDAMPTSTQTKALGITAPGVPERHRTLRTGENESPAKRSSQKRATDGDDEERAVNIKVPIALKQFGGKLSRLARYNGWIFTSTKPDWVREHAPTFYKGYFRFYANRMYT